MFTIAMPMSLCGSHPPTPSALREKNNARHNEQYMEDSTKLNTHCSGLGFLGC